MWFHSRSFALSRECYGFKLFQCVFSHVTSKRSPMRLWIVWSMYIGTHVESKADSIFRLIRVYGLWREILRLTLWSECSSRSMSSCMLHCWVIAFGPETCSAWHCGVIAFGPETCSAWHCGVICPHVHVFYGIQSQWLWCKRLFNVQFNSRCTLLHQTICHALADLFYWSAYSACSMLYSKAVWW